MKGLLQSKRFRKNLYKWITMYIGVMLVFTSVVTYSKYISQFPYEDNTRIAKFDIKVDTIDETICKKDTETNGKICDIGTLSPLGDLNYYFKVDTSELEVNTMLVLNINVNNKEFVINTISESQELDKLLTSNNQGDNINIVDCASNNCNKITRTIVAGSQKITYYKISLKYNGDVSKPGESSKTEYKDIVTVGYSATQLK